VVRLCLNRIRPCGQGQFHLYHIRQGGGLHHFDVYRRSGVTLRAHSLGAKLQRQHPRGVAAPVAQLHPHGDSQPFGHRLFHASERIRANRPEVVDQDAEIEESHLPVAVQVSVGVEVGVVFGQAEAGGQQSVVQEGHLVVSVNVAVEQDEGWRLLCAGEGHQQEQ
jgi:hypothetical protein